MAIAPSNNLLSALSQLQSRPPAQPPRVANTGSQHQPVANTGRAQNSFAAQLGGVPVQTSSAGAATAAAQPASQSPPQSRGGYLGRHINIVV